MSAALQLVYSRPEQPQETKRMQDGFVAVPNGMMDALLSADLTGRQLKMALAVIRKTIGYGKTDDDCTITQLAELAGMERSNASVTFQQLVAMNVIGASKGKHGYLVRMNSPELWKEKSNTNVSKQYAQNDTNVSKQYGEAYQNDTHNRQLQQTITTTPCIPQRSDGKQDKPAEKQSRSAGLKTFSRWMDEVKDADEKPIPADDAIFAYAEDAGIPTDFLRLAWVEFRDRYSNEAKRYKDWRIVFRKSVRECWFKLWYFDAGQYSLTSKGQQAMQAMQAREARQ